MARPKTTPVRRKKRPARRDTSEAAAAGKRPPGKKSAADAPDRALRQLDGRFREWRYEGKTSGRDYAEVVVLSLAGVVAGAGSWLVFLAAEGHKWAPYGPYLLAGAAIVVVGHLLFGRGKAAALRVGDLGVGVEDPDGRVARLAWYRVERVAMVKGRVRIDGGDPLSIDPLAHPDAAARLVAEALGRIPKRVELDDADIDRLGTPNPDAGKRLRVNPPQIAGESCLASHKALTFEQDVRLCGRCGAPYHKSSVPEKCVECGRALRR